MLGEFVCAQWGVSSLITFSSKILRPQSRWQRRAIPPVFCQQRHCEFVFLPSSLRRRVEKRKWQAIPRNCSHQLLEPKESRSSSKLCKYFYGQSLGTTHTDRQQKNYMKIWSHQPIIMKPRKLLAMRWAVKGSFSSLMDGRDLGRTFHFSVCICHVTIFSCSTNDHELL